MNKQVMSGILDYAIWLVIFLAGLITGVHMNSLVWIILNVAVVFYTLYNLYETQKSILNSWNIHLPTELKHNLVKGETNAT